MLKKNITYENPFTGEMVTEEHYFHISKADLVEMELEEHKATYVKDGETLTGMQAKLQRIVDSEDGKAIMSEFKDIIRRSYGKKDGDRFLKSKEIWESFNGSEAYSQLIFEILTQADSAAEFINGVVPSNLEVIAAEIRAQAEKNGAPAIEPETPDPTAVEPRILTDTEVRILTKAEVDVMDYEELKSGLAEGRYRLA